jgi:hypothetical protein
MTDANPAVSAALAAASATSDPVDAQRAEYADAIKKLQVNTKRNRLEIGRYLNEAGKLSLGHGEFLSWFERQKFHFSLRTAERMMNAARAFEGKFDTVSILPFHWSAITLLSTRHMPEAARDEAISLAQSGRQVDRTVAKQIIAEHRKRRPQRGSRNRIPPITARLLESVEGVVKELRAFCKEEIEIGFEHPTENDGELAHRARVRFFDQISAKVYGGDYVALLRDVELARGSSGQSEAADGSVQNSELEAMAE